MWEPNVPLKNVFCCWFFCLNVHLICHSPDAIAQIYASLLRNIFSISREHGIVLQSKSGSLFFRENFLLFYLWMYFLFPCGLATSRMPVILMLDHLCLSSSHASFALITLVLLPFHLHSLIISSLLCVSSLIFSGVIMLLCSLIYVLAL